MTSFGPAAAVAAAVVAGLALFSFLVARIIDRRYPPTGRFMRIDGVMVHLVETGDPRDRRLPIIAIHGASGNVREIRMALDDRIATRFAGRRIIYVDRPGHGHSSRGPRRMSAPDAQARLIAGILDRLKIDRALVIGHSLGAAVAVALPLVAPERVAGLVLVAPATHPWPGGITWYYRLSAMPVVGWLFCQTLALPAGFLLMKPSIRSVFSPDPVPADYQTRAAIPLVLRPGNFRANAADVADLKVNVTRLSTHYHGIAVPVEIVTGDTDSVVWPHIHSDGLARDIPGAGLTRLEGVGHMPHHARPEAVLAAIERADSRIAETNKAA